jgi:hypothetical protein
VSWPFAVVQGILQIGTFLSMVVVRVHRCSGALSSNCRQLLSSLRRTGYAIQMTTKGGQQSPNSSLIHPRRFIVAIRS